MGSILRHTRPPTLSLAQARDQFIADLLTLTGDTRLLWLPGGADTTTSTDKSLNARTFTYDATIADRLSRLGLGYSVSFNGTANRATVPDAAGLSFGSGTADSAFSILALVNVTDTAAARRILTKTDNGSNKEWDFGIGSTDGLQMQLFDQSAGVNALRASDTAVNQGAWVLLAMTYSAATGGATAANDITQYQNGIVKASTATNNASYVAMEDLGTSVALGSNNIATPTNYFSGSMAMVVLCQKSLSASEHWAVKNLVNGYFGLAL